MEADESSQDRRLVAGCLLCLSVCLQLNPPFKEHPFERSFNFQKSKPQKLANGSGRRDSLNMLRCTKVSEAVGVCSPISSSLFLKKSRLVEVHFISNLTKGSPFRSKSPPIKSKSSPVKSKSLPIQSKSSPIKTKSSPIKTEPSPFKNKTSLIQNKTSRFYPSDMQFPVDVDAAQQDHPQLEASVLQSLFRRLHALNRCARVHQQRVTHTDDSEDEQCALSDNWIYEVDTRRWSRTCQNMQIREYLSIKP